MLGLGFWSEDVMADKTKTCMNRHLGGLGWGGELDVMLLVIVTMLFED
jgi:hypothetical protein